MEKSWGRNFKTEDFKNCIVFDGERFWQITETWYSVETKNPTIFVCRAINGMPIERDFYPSELEKFNRDTLPEYLKGYEISTVCY